MVKMVFSSKYRTNWLKQHILLQKIRLRNHAESESDKEAKIPLVREKLDFNSMDGHVKGIHESEGYL